MNDASDVLAIARQRAELLGRFREVARLIGRQRHSEQLLRNTCDLLVELNVVDACAIALSNGEGPALIATAGSGAHFERIRVLLDMGELTPCMKLAASLQIVNRSPHDERCASCPASGHNHDAMALPLSHGPWARGVLLVVWPQGQATDEVRKLRRELMRETGADLADALSAMDASRRRDEADLELRRTRDHLDAIVGASPAAILSLDRQGNVLSWSPAAAQIFGWTAEEVIGRPPPFIAPEKQAQFGTLTARVLGGETLHQVELERRRRDKAVVPISLSAAPLRGADGEVDGIMAVAIDLTEHRRVEQSLQQSEVQLSNLLANLPGMAYRCRNDRDWTMEFVSDGCIELTGHMPAELIGNAKASYADLIHTEDQQRVWQQVQTAIEADRPFQLEYRLRAASGVDKWVWERGRAVHGSDGELWLEGLITDVSRRKRSELERERIAEALRASEAKSRALYQRLPIPTFVWQQMEDDFVLIDFNEAALDATGGSVRTWIGQHASRAHQDRPDVLSDLRRCFVDRSSFEREMSYHYRQSDAQLQLVVTYGFVAPDMVLVHTQDVTQQRQMEEQLRLAQKLEAIGRLAGGIAHDFNNILTVIGSCAAFALDGLDDGARAHKDLHEIRKATDRAAALTRQLLAFSRKQILQPAVLDLNQVASNMEIMLMRLLGEDILLESRLAADLGRVRADRGQLEQVLMNVAVNARDAMPDGGNLCIETANRELDASFAASHPECTPGPHVMLLVTDDGAGMTPETLARAFEPFFTTKGPGKGTGLGLSTAYGIIAQSGGAITVDSAPGAGTSVRIYLPQVQDGLSPAAPLNEVTPRGHETVLLVEDEDSVRSLVARILELAGYHVIAATDGLQALRVAEAHEGNIDLLLTDVIMPRVSGREVAEALTRQRPTLRVLYMSGYTDDAIVHHGVLSEGTHFLGKPFSREQLLAKIRDVLADSRSG